jgi:hypothetical protein
MQYEQIGTDQFFWLHRAGVPLDVLTSLMPLRFAMGRRANDGIFEDDQGGNAFLVFEEPEDTIFWQPKTGTLASALNRAFALGEDVIYNAGTYSFGGHLSIYNSPLDWLRNRCDGCVVVHWNRAFDRLRDAPRIAISAELLPVYRRHMRPARLPVLSVIVADGEAAAA